MDKRLIILAALFITGSLAFFLYRKLYYKPEGIHYTIKPLNAIRVADSIHFEDQTPDASRWKWDFGDGEFSADQSGSHTYLQAGKFKVALTAYGPFGSMRHEDVVNVLGGPAPAAAPAGLSITGPTDIKAGQAASFGSSIAASSYEWKVEGDPAQKQSTAAASFKFPKPGAHTIVLTLHNPDHSAHKDITVTPADVAAPAPVAAHPAPIAQPVKPKPHPAAHPQQAQHGNALDNLDNGVEIKK